ncbi:MAG: hypothetical protein R3Y29_03505 [bacterium]
MKFDVIYKFKIEVDNKETLEYILESKEFGYTDDILDLIIFLAPMYEIMEFDTYEEIKNLLDKFINKIVFNEEEIENNWHNYLNKLDKDLVEEDALLNYDSVIELKFKTNSEIITTVIKGVFWEIDVLDYKDIKYAPPALDLFKPLEDIQDFRNLKVKDIKAISDVKNINLSPPIVLDVFRIQDTLYEKFNYFE